LRANYLATFDAISICTRANCRCLDYSPIWCLLCRDNY
jgi:hypothetical protein